MALGCAAAEGGIALSGCVLSGLCFSEAGADDPAFSSSIWEGRGADALFSDTGATGGDAVGEVAAGCVWSGVCAFCESATNVTV